MYKPDCELSVLKSVTSAHASFGGAIMSHKAYSSFHRSMFADLRLFYQYFSLLLVWLMSKMFKVLEDNTPQSLYEVTLRLIKKKISLHYEVGSCLN